MIEWLAEHGPKVTLVAFFSGFIGIGLWAFLPTNRTKLQDYGNIPLKERPDQGEQDHD